MWARATGPCGRHHRRPERREGGRAGKAGAIAAAREAIGALNSKLAPDHQEDVPTLLNHANQTQAGDANMLMYKTWAEVR